MFRRHGFFRILLLGFLVMGVISMIRGASYRSAWMQGFAAGQAVDGAATTEDGAPADAPAAQAPYYRGPHWGHGGGFSPFWIVGGFFKFALLLFFLGFLFKRFRFGRGHHWHHHRQEWPKGKTPPWYDDSGDEPIMKA